MITIFKTDKGKIIHNLPREIKHCLIFTKKEYSKYFLRPFNYNSDEIIDKELDKINNNILERKGK